MAILTELQRDEAWAQFMAWLGTTHESVALNKQALRAASSGSDGNARREEAGTEVTPCATEEG